MTSHPTFDIAGKRVLLVGATGVLGRAYGRALVNAGARVALADQPGSDLADFAAAIAPDTDVVEMDVTQEESVVRGVADAVERLGGLDAAINNAAITGEMLMAEGDAFAPFEEYPLALWRRTLDVNLSGTFLVAREAGRCLKTSGGGSLVNVSSIYGLVGPDHRIYEGESFSSFPGYSASKAGVIGLTRWLATWWGRDGVRVNVVTPGGVFNEHDEAFANAYGMRTPMGRMADREELVGIILYLISDASSYCTGQNFIVDGGYTAW